MIFFCAWIKLNKHQKVPCSQDEPSIFGSVIILSFLIFVLFVIFDYLWHTMIYAGEGIFAELSIIRAERLNNKWGVKFQQEGVPIRFPNQSLDLK